MPDWQPSARAVREPRTPSESLKPLKPGATAGTVWQLRAVIITPQSFLYGSALSFVASAGKHAADVLSPRSGLGRGAGQAGTQGSGVEAFVALPMTLHPHRTDREAIIPICVGMAGMGALLM